MIFIKRINREKREFFYQDTVELAKQLLGKLIIREKEGRQLVVRITETEAYVGPVDKACHAYNYRKTQRTKTLFEKGGTAYVYMIYGMYYCLNVVSEPEGEPCAVLIRGAEPVSEVDEISQNRFNAPYSELSPYRRKNLLNGPGKLCKALDIDKSINGEDMCKGKAIYIADDGGAGKREIKTGKRINIDYAEEAADFLWRFYYD